MVIWEFAEFILWIDEELNDQERQKGKGKNTTLSSRDGRGLRLGVC